MTDRLLVLSSIAKGALSMNLLEALVDPSGASR